MVKNGQRYNILFSSKKKSQENFCKSCGCVIKLSSNFNSNKKYSLCQICKIRNSSDKFIDTQEASNDELLFSCKYRLNGCKVKFNIKTLDRMLLHLKNCEHSKNKSETKYPYKINETIKFSNIDCIPNLNVKTEGFIEKSKSLKMENLNEEQNLKEMIMHLDEKYFSLFGFLNQKIKDMENRNIHITEDFNTTLDEIAYNKKQSSNQTNVNFDANMEKNILINEEKNSNIQIEFMELINKFNSFDKDIESYKDEIDNKFKELNKKIKQIKFSTNYSNLDLQIKITKLNFPTYLQTSKYRDTNFTYKPFLDSSTKKISSKNNNNVVTSIFKSDPSLLKFHSKFTYYDGINLPNIFSMFEMEKDLILAYPAKDYNIELIKIKNKQLLKTLSGHESFIFCIRHKKINQIDYLITSSYDQSLKIWNLSNYSLLLSIPKCHLSTSLYSCLLVCVNNTNNIISSVFDNELMKVYDMTGNLFKEIGNNQDRTLFIDIWEKTNNDNYIINCNHNDVKIYELSTGKVLKTFQQKGETSSHCCALILEEEKNTFLFECDDKGIIRQWDITSGTLINFLQVGKYLSCIISWGNNFILGADVGNIKVLNIKEWKVIKNLQVGNKNEFYLGTLIKFFHPELGESLMCGLDCYDNKICLWTTIKSLSSTI